MIERKPGDGAAATTDVNKRPVVREEVNIRKQEHEDMKQVSENVGREELDIDTSGDAHVEDLRDNDRNKRDRS